MQGRGRFFIIFGVVLLGLVIVGALLIVALQSRGRGTPTPPPSEGPETVATEVVPEMQEVVVALQNIGEGEKIRPDAVGVRSVEVSELPEKPILDPSDVIGKLAWRDIYQKQPLTEDMVIAVEDVQKLGWLASPLIPSGRVAVAFPVSQLSSVNYAIQPGDRVDVLISGSFLDVDPDSQIETPLLYEGGEDCQPGCQVVGQQVQRYFTQLTIDDAQVLGLGTWGVPPKPVEEEAAAEGEGEPGAGEAELPSAYNTIILIVTPQDAAVLKYLRENRYAIDLALRSRDDADKHEPEAVTLEYIMRRFRISPPTKLPYRAQNDFEEITYPAPEPPPPPQE